MQQGLALTRLRELVLLLPYLLAPGGRTGRALTMAEQHQPAAEEVDHPFGDELPSPGTLARAASVSYTPSEDIKPLSDPDEKLVI